MNMPKEVYENFDFVFLDELRFLRFHLATDVYMGATRQAVMRIFHIVVKNGVTVVGAQDRLHERDVEMVCKVDLTLVLLCLMCDDQLL